MKRLQSIVLTALLLWLTMPAFAESDFEKWQRQRMQNFQQFKDQRDKDFTAFLKAHWRKMRLLRGKVRDKKPKPTRIPRAKIKRRTKPVSRLPRVKPPVIRPKPQKVQPPPKQPPARFKGTPTNVNFYGHQLPFRYDPAFKAHLGRTINKQSISEYWAELSRADYETLLTQLRELRRALQLNDWAYLQLIHKLIKKIHPKSANEQRFITWFLLTKEGYQARIAYSGRHVYLLMTSKQTLYAVSFFTFDGQRYYVIPVDGSSQQLGQVYTYDNHYPGANKPLDMRLSTAIATKRQPRTRRLVFKYGKKKYRLKVAYDKQTVDFFKSYPQMDIGLYFMSAVHPETSEPLLKQLRPLVKGKSELDAINLLLHFVQTAFSYKTDEDQFGVENYLFPEETFFYPYSDCEDRSVLFAWLVRNLVGLEVVGLDYPGHIATAVRFNGRVEGDSIQYRGKTYVIADPTYINARAGMAMPQFKRNKPGVISLM